MLCTRCRFPNSGIRAKPRGHERLRPACKGLSPAARPQGPTAHGVTARGSHPRPSRRWWLPAASSQGVAPRLGLPLARAATGRSDRQQGQRPREVASPAR
ncbi:hypothetical protein GW17_00048320 [Ensete ventricosum]|nr:hypothetical protein GW17_00048320 [Ensete ventricosum]